MEIGTTKRIVEVEPINDPFRKDDEPAPVVVPERDLEPVEVPALV